MKSTGIVRKIDELGRIVIPKEMRTGMGIDQNDPLEIYVENGRIILEKYIPACIFCGGNRDVSLFKGKKVCAVCAAELGKEER